MTPRLTAIGDDLERAARADLRTRRRRRRITGGAIGLALLIPGAAVAGVLLNAEDVARSMPAGTRSSSAPRRSARSSRRASSTAAPSRGS